MWKCRGWSWWKQLGFGAYFGSPSAKLRVLSKLRWNLASWRKSWKTSVDSRQHSNDGLIVYFWIFSNDLDVCCNMLLSFIDFFSRESTRAVAATKVWKNLFVTQLGIWPRSLKPSIYWIYWVLDANDVILCNIGVCLFALLSYALHWSSSHFIAWVACRNVMQRIWLWETHLTMRPIADALDGSTWDMIRCRV